LLQNRSACSASANQNSRYGRIAIKAKEPDEIHCGVMLKARDAKEEAAVLSALIY